MMLIVIMQTLYFSAVVTAALSLLLNSNNTTNYGSLPLLTIKEEAAIARWVIHHHRSGVLKELKGGCSVYIADVPYTETTTTTLSSSSSSSSTGNIYFDPYITGKSYNSEYNKVSFSVGDVSTRCSNQNRIELLPYSLIDMRCIMLTVSGTMVNVTEKMELAIVRQAFEERYANDNADSIPPVDGDGHSHSRVGNRRSAEDIIGRGFYRLEMQEMMLTMLSTNGSDGETVQKQVDLKQYYDLYLEGEEYLVLKELYYRLVMSISREVDVPQLDGRDDDYMLQFHNDNDADDVPAGGSQQVGVVHNDSTVPLAAHVDDASVVARCIVGNNFMGDLYFGTDGDHVSVMRRINHFGSFFFDADLIDRHLKRSAQGETVTLVVTDDAHTDFSSPLLDDVSGDGDGDGSGVDSTDLSCSTVTIVGNLIRGRGDEVAETAPAAEQGSWFNAQDRIYRLHVTTIKLNEEPRGRSVSVDVEDFYAVDADQIVRCLLQSYY